MTKVPVLRCHSQPCFPWMPQDRWIQRQRRQRARAARRAPCFAATHIRSFENFAATIANPVNRWCFWMCGTMRYWLAKELLVLRLGGGFLETIFNILKNVYYVYIYIYSTRTVKWCEENNVRNERTKVKPFPWPVSPLSKNHMVAIHHTDTLQQKKMRLQWFKQCLILVFQNQCPSKISWPTCDYS